MATDGSRRFEEAPGGIRSGGKSFRQALSTFVVVLLRVKEQAFGWGASDEKEKHHEYWEITLDKPCVSHGE